MSDIVMDPERPMFFGYDMEFLIGGAVIHDDGTVTVTFTDPNVVNYIKAYKAENIRGFTAYHNPAFRLENQDERNST